MIRKSNLRYAVFALMLAPLAGCEVLNQVPPSALSEAEAFATPDRISKTAIGMYDQLQNAEFLGGRALIYSDIRSDDTNPAGYFTNVPVFNQQANDAFAANAWTAGYRTLYGVNYFQQQLAKYPGVTTAALETQYVGEAKFIRALVYFHLVNLFAQPYNFTADASHLGVPIQLTAPDGATAFDATQNLPRASVREVYAQIEKDLNDAITALPETYASGSFERTGRATKDAARALLSRVYLYKGQYADAATMAGNVISGGRHVLQALPNAPFQLAARTTETIFSVNMSSADNPNTNNAIGQHYGGTKRADIIVTPYARIDSTQFRSKDRRRTLLLNPPTYPAATSVNVFTTKYPSGPADDVMISRYSEVLLNRAEGLAQTATGVSTDAITLLNQVRSRSVPNIPAYPAYTAASFASKQALIDAILFERRLELAFEGHRYYDLMRYKRNSSRINYGDQKAVFPIPLADIQQNPNLVQNPGY
jgi:hypothetical protein